MQTLLERVESLDVAIRALRKIESKMNSGQFIPAFREVCRLASEFERNKADLLKSAEQEDGSEN